jgi:hypothetical protein
MKLYIALILLAYSHQSAIAQESRGRDCPVIHISHTEPASTGSPLIYNVYIKNGDALVTPKFNWTVWEGKITSGQGTSEVSVETEGNKSITVTVEVMGYPANCQNKASYTTIVERVMSHKVDEYRDLKFSEERLRLDQFAIALQNEPGSKGYIIIYDATDTRKSSVRERGERAKKYLIKEWGIPETRIVIVNGGHRYTRAVELFITPTGALPPTATPKLSK